MSLTNDVTSSFVFGRAKRSRLRKKLRNAIPARILDRFRPIFEKVQGELEVGARHTLKYGDNAEVRKGDLFILDGQKVIVADMGDPFVSDYGRPDRRLMGRV